MHEHDGEPTVGIWTRRLVIFLRVMAGVSLLKGLYHWSRICGVGVSDEDLYVTHAIAWQTATVFFAVIDLVAAVGLWLAAAWGAVIWLTAVASMIAVQLFFSAGVRPRHVQHSVRGRRACRLFDAGAEGGARTAGVINKTKA